ncbi:DUF2202 domain-containing protein [Soehngenia saccharolytica]|nr:DUF2202 domain-containing protein [Soehngenia saccharolytica]
MKNLLKKASITMALVSMVSIGMGTTNYSYADDALIGAQAALNDKSYTQEEMIAYALQDEYLAKAEYEKIISALNVSRPFSNILRAENTHIDLIEPLLEDYDIKFTVPNVENYLVTPTNLLEAYKVGLDTEKQNIQMYENFLKEDLDADVKLVFQKLLNASKSHLQAFERQVERYNGDYTNTGFQRNGRIGKNTSANNQRGTRANGTTFRCLDEINIY